MPDRLHRLNKNLWKIKEHRFRPLHLRSLKSLNQSSLNKRLNRRHGLHCLLHQRPTYKLDREQRRQHLPHTHRRRTASPNVRTYTIRHSTTAAATPTFDCTLLTPCGHCQVYVPGVEKVCVICAWQIAAVKMTARNAASCLVISRDAASCLPSLGTKP